MDALNFKMVRFFLPGGIFILLCLDNTVKDISFVWVRSKFRAIRPTSPKWGKLGILGKTLVDSVLQYQRAFPCWKSLNRSDPNESAMFFTHFENNITILATYCFI